MVTYKDYIRVLEKWICFAKNFIYSTREDLEVFGTGYNNWAISTHQKAFSAFAVCAAMPEIDEKGMKKDEVLQHSLKMLRFSLESHIEGTYHCLDGTKWGHTWISVLGIERMMHGIFAIKQHLTEKDWHLLKKVMISEADWLVDEYYRDEPEKKGKICAGKTEHNHPESNIWNGAHLLRTVAMFPDVERKQQYIEKGTSFIVNGISVASDAKSKEIVNGRPISQWHIGDNFFPSFALNHHGYLNIGYMVICLSNIAMLHFGYKQLGLKPPEFIYRNVEDLWKLVKSCTFPDGRLCRIGGDTRIRYCYCQDYACVVWMLMREKFGDRDCENLEKNWLEMVKKEMEKNKDGSFLSCRCKELADVAPIYYLRLETDRAASLSMIAYWKMLFKNSLKKKSKKTYHLNQAWHDAYHGSCLVRGKNRIASFCWLAAQNPQGLCLPVNKSNLAEWRNNLSGYVCGYGRFNYQNTVSHREFLFENGFATYGKTQIYSDSFISEGQKGEILAENRIVFIALGDDTTCVLMQKCTASMPVSYIHSVKGLFLNVPNDIFNDNKRNYWFEYGRKVLKGPSKKQEKIEIFSQWLNVDNCLGIVAVYGSKKFTIYRAEKRQAGLKLNQFEAEAIGTGLFVDEICYPYREKLRLEKGESIYDICCVVLAGKNALQTEAFSKNNLFLPEIEAGSDVKTAGIKGFDGKDYIILANMGEEKAHPVIKNITKAKSLITKRSFTFSDALRLSLSSGMVEVLQVEH